MSGEMAEVIAQQDSCFKMTLAPSIDVTAEYGANEDLELVVLNLYGNVVEVNLPEDRLRIPANYSDFYPVKQGDDWGDRRIETFLESSLSGLGSDQILLPRYLLKILGERIQSLEIHREGEALFIRFSEGEIDGVNSQVVRIPRLKTDSSPQVYSYTESAKEVLQRVNPYFLETVLSSLGRVREVCGNSEVSRFTKRIWETILSGVVFREISGTNASQVKHWKGHSPEFFVHSRTYSIQERSANNREGDSLVVDYRIKGGLDKYGLEGLTIREVSGRVDIIPEVKSGGQVSEGQAIESMAEFMEVYKLQDILEGHRARRSESPTYTAGYTVGGPGEQLVLDTKNISLQDSEIKATYGYHNGKLGLVRLIMPGIDLSFNLLEHTITLKTDSTRDNKTNSYEFPDFTLLPNGNLSSTPAVNRFLARFGLQVLPAFDDNQGSFTIKVLNEKTETLTKVNFPKASEDGQAETSEVEGTDTVRLRCILSDVAETLLIPVNNREVDELRRLLISRVLKEASNDESVVDYKHYPQIKASLDISNEIRLRLSYNLEKEKGKISFEPSSIQPWAKVIDIDGIGIRKIEIVMGDQSVEVQLKSTDNEVLNGASAKEALTALVQKLSTQIR
jgi:hypothetical protein